MLRFQETVGSRSPAFRVCAVLGAVALFGLAGKTTRAQQPEINLDERKVNAYTLPDPLTMAEGRKVATSVQWIEERRPELMRLFQTHVYGRVPQPLRPIRPTSQVRSEDKQALGGKAVRREISIRFSDKADGPRMDLLLYLPRTAGTSKRAPAFLALNFEGNHAISHDPGITLSRQWMRNDPDKRVVDHQATESSRGADSARWPVERILARGYALATAYYGDLDPDYDDGFKNGIHPLFYHPGQTRPAADEWGAIGAWAWGLSRALDYLETAPEIEARQVAVMGHSRLGKTALWAGAEDPRFAIVISNDSGCGGAALSRRIFGETVARINTSFPHWFCSNFHQYNGREDLLPVDQHELIALIAPRPVLICSAGEDLWADPKGEFLAALAADPVYRLLGTDGLAITEMPRPAPNQLVKSTIGYHFRPGQHDVTDDDWNAFMDFADHHFRRVSR
ncbi:MAG TPA: acetylxylan esterase [Isosphaeraceae bacterium]|nr:acetylxylan esterase [Isosphaeraceae bacterium]